MIANIELSDSVCASAQLRASLTLAVGVALRLRVQLEAQRSGVWAAFLLADPSDVDGSANRPAAVRRTRAAGCDRPTGFGIVVRRDAGDVLRVVSTPC